MLKFRMRFLVIFAMVSVAALSLGVSDPQSTSPPSPQDDGTLPGLTAIAGQGMMQSKAYKNLEYLSDFIGPRLTGSHGAEEAVRWGLERMKAIGLEVVHAEPYEMWRGWTRGPASAEMLFPVRRSLTIASMGWVGSTPEGGVTADAMPVNLFQMDREMKDNAPKWAGKILVMVAKGQARDNGMELFAKFGKLLKAAYAAHAVAVIGGQGGGFPRV